jgi:hypothetical protein
MTQKYTKNDLTVRHHQTNKEDNMAYTHKVLFNRPLRYKKNGKKIQKPQNKNPKKTKSSNPKIQKQKTPKAKILGRLDQAEADVAVAVVIRVPVAVSHPDAPRFVEPSTAAQHQTTAVPAFFPSTANNRRTIPKRLN